MGASSLSLERLAELLQPYFVANGIQAIDNKIVIQKIDEYLELLLRWNARTNLTAIREPEEIMRRHFGESLFAGGVLRGKLKQWASVLDFGSGAGFPGIPIQICCPDFQVVLGESQGKKAAFLREVVRTLGLVSEVWAGRVESMPESRTFDCVVMRAVDRMDDAVSEAAKRVGPGGYLAILAGEDAAALSGWVAERYPVPGSDRRQMVLYTRAG